MSTPLFIVTPHSSGHVPNDVLWEMMGESSREPRARQERSDYLFDQGDPYTDVIFHRPGACHLHAAVSRFVVDLNRERDEVGPNGVVKLTDFDAAPLYPPTFRLSNAEIEERLARYWDPFHKELERTLREHEVQLLIVGHAMSPFGPAVGPDTGQPRPALSLMTGGNAHGEAVGPELPSVAPAAAKALQAAARHHFAPLFEQAPAVPSEVALNDPWSADEISMRYSRPGQSGCVPAFGLEVNRALYLPGGRLGSPLPGRLQALQQAFAAFAEEALQIVSAHPRGDRV